MYTFVFKADKYLVAFRNYFFVLKGNVTFVF